MNSYDIDFEREESDMNAKKVGNNSGGVATEIKALCGVLLLGVGGGLVGEVLKSVEERVECESSVRMRMGVVDGEALVGVGDEMLGGVYIDCELVRDRRW